MNDDKITYDDVREYETLFTLAPSFLLETFAKRGTNLVSKFKSQVDFYLNTLTAEQKHKLDLILASDIDELQMIMQESYKKTGIKQFAILANPAYKVFIKDNLDEIRSML